MVDRHTDLPLFAWKPRCVLIAFPLGKRVGIARSTAIALQVRPANLRDPYWQRQARKFCQELKALGYSQHAIESELDAFRSAVVRELISRPLRSAGGAPEDAA
ncbi:DUF6074 family protein [Rhizobium leguminosarum]|uniref:DUF6074 family protein n=1 Tax=Rhizobium leguminosarum TaxID=384 RepID=UPI003D7AD70D